ncbi:MAG: type II secretion system protein [Candidatus Saccharimonadaceae bacterium]|nr:type II secretion system protein [Candidatus Saccharimonadaceae bacterium]
MSNKKLSTTKKGFTIIEVVLVLAIAGLIFLMVFVALPALQRNQRDTQRRQDYADLAAVITASASNNGTPRGYTSTGETINNDLAKQIINKNGNDPEGRSYTGVIKIKPSGDQGAPTNPGQINVYYKSKCKPDGSNTAVNGGNKQFTVQGYLETGSYCNTYEY